MNNFKFNSSYGTCQHQEILQWKGYEHVAGDQMIFKCENCFMYIYNKYERQFVLLQSERTAASSLL
jgi:hypothetical protein